MVDKYFISSASMDKLYKVKLLSCFRNKHFANKKEAYCAIVFAGLTNDSGAQEISEQESIWETSLTYKKLPRAPRGPARWETTPRKLGLVLINPEHIYRHDCTALCRRSDAIIILTFQMQKTAAQKVWWPRVPSKLNATATKLSPQTCAAVTAVATGGTGAAGAALQLHPPRGWALFLALCVHQPMKPSPQPCGGGRQVCLWTTSLLFLYTAHHIRPAAFPLKSKWAPQSLHVLSTQIKNCF